MIKNEHQYKITKTWINKFQHSLASLENNQEKQKNDPLGWEILRQSYQSQLTNLQEEIAEYEGLVNHNLNDSFSFQLTKLTDIGKILIKLRIGLKMTPSTLAMLAGLNEQDIISYEEEEYQNASFIDILTISDILGIKINDGTITASLDKSSLEVLEKNTPNQQEKLFTFTS